MVTTQSHLPIRYLLTLGQLRKKKSQGERGIQREPVLPPLMLLEQAGDREGEREYNTMRPSMINILSVHHTIYQCMYLHYRFYRATQTIHLHHTTIYIVGPVTQYNVRMTMRGHTHTHTHTHPPTQMMLYQ